MFAKIPSRIIKFLFIGAICDMILRQIYTNESNLKIVIYNYIPPNSNTDEQIKR